MSAPVSTLDETSFDALAPVTRADCIVREYGAEAVAWSPAATAPTHLDAVAHLVWQLLDGSATLGEIVQDVHDVLGIPPAVARQQLRRALLVLEQARLVGSAAEKPALSPSDHDFFSQPPNP